MSAGVILVSTLGGQTTGSGCCGKVEGECCDLGDEAPFAQVQGAHALLVARAQEHAAAAGLGLEVVDARNTIGLIVAYHQQVRAFGWPGLGAALRGYLGWFPVPCLLVRGKVEAVPPG